MRLESSWWARSRKTFADCVCGWLWFWSHLRLWKSANGCITSVWVIIVFPLTWSFSFLPAKTYWKGFQEVFWLQFGHYGVTIFLRSGQRCIKWYKILLWHKLYFQSLTFPLFTLSKESELRLCIMFCQKSEKILCNGAFLRWKIVPGLIYGSKVFL